MSCCKMRIDDGEGHTGEVAAEILVAVLTVPPEEVTPTPTLPGFEAVFANFSLKLLRKVLSKTLRGKEKFIKIILYHEGRKF
ncbi:MAG: hypothetical protein N2V78_05055 [Methanophagales archaeon]|nr:hypothetical protein [Methanophagales archaeon]